MSNLASSQNSIVQKGLTEPEAAARRAAGQGNDLPLQSSRTYADIFRDNLFTFINIVLFLISLVLIALGRVDDVGVIAFVISTNVIVNIYQEIRAKRKLDRIALVTRPKVTLIRDGQEKVTDPNDIVVGDLLVVHPGDQIVVDGSVVGDGEVNMDESLLTGEADLIQKQAGDLLYSGSFCVSGTAYYTAEKVGKDSYANQLTAGAKTFRRVLTPLQKEINLIVRLLLVAAIFIWLLAGISLLIGLTPFAQTVENAAVIAGLVPSGLFLMITLAYALGSVRLADRNALIQQSNAVESLSHVNVMCLDKTGTLTANRIQLQSVQPIGISESDLRSWLGDYAASTSASNKTNDAIAHACPGQKRPIHEEVPFASAYKWSAIAFSDRTVTQNSTLNTQNPQPPTPNLQPPISNPQPPTSNPQSPTPNPQFPTFVLGAPDILMAYVPLEASLHQAIQDATAAGLRVLLFAYTPTWTAMRTEDANHPQLPPDLQPLGLLLFGDELRPRVQETLSRFQNNGIQVKVISGDNPQTVAALAAQAGVGTEAMPIKTISGPELAELDEAQFVQAATETTIFGRITPDQKARLVKALQKSGNYVAMMGDGVNDVPSLKQANVGIAMESGSQITRGVADMILMQDSFEALPDAFLEGQRIRNSIQDVTKISLVRVFAFVLMMLTTVMTGVIFPITIKYNAIMTLLTEGVPTLGVTLWAKPGQPTQGGLLRSVMFFVLPAMALLALFSLLVYLGAAAAQVAPIMRLLEGEMTLQQLSQVVTLNRLMAVLSFARNVLLTFLIFCCLLILLFLKPPTRFWTGGAPFSGDWRYAGMALLMLVAYGVLLAVPGLRNLFDLQVLSALEYLLIALMAFIWALVLRYAWRHRWLERFLQIEGTQTSEP